MAVEIFAADDGVNGREIWFSNGTPTGTFRLKDINPGAAGSDPAGFVVSGGFVYFRANDPTNGYSLWRTDGSAAGTILLRENIGFSAPLIDFNGTLLSYGYDTVSGTYGILKSNGTVAGTGLVSSVGNFTGSEGFTVAGTKAFFVASPNGQSELWVTDGTAGNGTTTGTYMVRDINASGGSYPQELTALGSKVIFTADDGVNGREIWVSDGTAGNGTTTGTFQLKDIRIGDQSSSPNGLIAVGGKVFFEATDASIGTRLWATDGTSANTIMVSNGAGDDPGYRLALNGKLYFSGSDTTNGSGLFVSDGTASGTVYVTSTIIYEQPVIAGGKLYFYGDGNNGGVDGTGLFVNDGVVGHASVLLASVNPDQLIVSGNRVFFTTSAGGAGNELWVSDGSAAGTHIVKDIYAGADASDPQVLTAYAGGVIFSAFDPVNGRELWFSDGTAAGTILAKDINALADHSPSTDLRERVAVGTTSIFAAGDAAHGVELWASDGTAAGTSLIKDIRIGTSSSELQQLTVVGSKVFFRAYDDDINGWRLWVTDGTAPGTIRLSDTVGGDPGYLIAYNGSLYFYGYDATNGYGLYTSDGTVAGTTFVKGLYEYRSPVILNGKLAFYGRDFAANDDGLIISDGTPGGTGIVKHLNDFDFYNVVGGKLFFQSSTAGNGSELWVSDGTGPGTVNVKDIAPGSDSSYPRNLTAFGSKLAFTADEADHGREIWISDGTTPGTTLLKDINTTVNPGYSLSIYESVSAGGKLYLAADDVIHGRELYVSDGTVAGTHIVTDIRPGGISAEVQQLTVVGSKVFFRAYDDAVAGWRLFALDSATNAITRLSDTVGGDPGNLIAFSGKLYFYGYDATNSYGLFTSDGTVTGTTFVKSLYEYRYPVILNGKLAFYGRDFAANDDGLIISDGTPGGTGIVKHLDNFDYYTVVGNKLFFQSSTAGNGQELWVSDGTAGGTFNVKDIAIGSDSSSPRNQTALGSKLIFTADESDHGRELWVSDGSTLGTTLLKDINTTSNLGYSLTIYESVSAGGKLYLAADDAVHGRELYVSDGTVAGTSIVTDMRLGSVSAEVQQLTVVGSKVFFRAYNDAVAGWRLFALDSATNAITRLSDTVGGDPGNLIAFSGKLCFYGYDATNSYGLFTSDGTVTGTTFVKGLYEYRYPVILNGKLAFYGRDFAANDDGLIISDGTPGGTGIVKHLDSFDYYVVAGGKLFFESSTGGNGSELWVSDGTGPGTINLKDINPSGNAYPRDLTVVGSKVFFTADDGGTLGREVWVSDGTPVGTIALGDLYPGAPSSGASNLTAAGAKLFFVANNSVNGYELWVSDGTPGGTQMVKDIIGGSGSSNPDQLTAVGSNLYFRADDGVTGRQLWKSDGTGVGTVAVTSSGYSLNLIGVLGTKLIYSENLGSGDTLFGYDGTTVTQLATNVYANDAPKVVGSQLYFRGYDGTNGYELWVTNGTVAGTSRLSNVGVANASGADQLTVAGTKVFFSANDGINGNEIWVTDGTAGGTQLVKNIQSGSGSSSPDQLTAIGSTVYFRADDGVTGRQLWKSDGTAANTVAVTTGGFSLNISAALGTKLIYSENLGSGDTLFSYDGTTVTQLATNVYANDAPKVVGSQLFFRGYDGTNGYELWVTNGTAPGTLRLSNAGIANASNPENITVAGSKLFFTADDGVNGREIWVSDGTSVGTTLLKNINTGGGSDPQQLVAIGSTLYFRANDGANGNQLWKSDGTGSGTVAVSTANYGYDLQYLTVVGTKLYFYGNIGGLGTGLFISDGSGAPTLVSDAYNAQGGLTVANGIVYFRGYDPTNGYEYYATNGTAGGTFRVTDASNPFGSGPTGFTTLPNVSPTVTAGVAGQFVDDNAFVNPFSTIVVDDLDRVDDADHRQTETITVTMDAAAKGAFTAASLTASGFSATATPGVYTFSGNSLQATTALQALVYDPTNNRVAVNSTETTTFTVNVNDGAGGITSTTASVISKSINDAPTIAGVVAGQTTNDKTNKAAFAAITIGDVDNPAQTVSVSVTLDSAAKGVLVGFSTGSYDAAAGRYTVSGTAAQVTAAIRSLQFDPTENRVAPNTTETTTFRIAAADSIAPTVENVATTVVTTSVNDAPTIAGAVASQAINDKGTRAAFSTVTVGDVDNPSQTIFASVTLDVAAKGALTGFTVGSYNVATGRYDVSGTAVQVTAAIRSLVFDPTDNRVAPNTTETTTFRIAASDTLAPTVENFVTTVVTTSVNDAPTITGAVASQAIGDKATKAAFSTVTIGDVDNPGQTIIASVTLDAAAKGTLGGFSTGTYDAAAGKYTVSGTAAQVTAAIRSLVFDPTENRVTPGATETTTFRIAATDSLAPTAENFVTTVVTTSTNDAPTVTGAVAGQAINDKGTRAAFTGVTVADVDIGQTITASVTLDTAAKGVLTGFSTGAYNAGTGQYTVQGTAAQVTAAIRSLVFDPTDNRVAPNTTDTTTFTIGLNDGGAGGTASNSTTTVVTTSVNDAPTISGALAGQTMSDKQTLAAFANVTLADVDPGQTVFASVTLDTAAKGKLIGFSVGSYNATTGRYEVSGTGAQVTAAIRGLLFDPTENRVAVGATETTTFRIAASDGLVPSATADLTTTVAATSVNDAPAAADDAKALPQRTATSGAVLTNDGDLDVGDTIRVSNIAVLSASTPVASGGSVQITGALGRLTIGSDGAYGYAADLEGTVGVGQSAIDDFTYTVSDTNGGSTTAHLRFTVTGSAQGDAADNLFLLNVGGYAVDGAGGTDTASFTNRTGQVVVALNGATPANVTVAGGADGTLANVENLTGGSVGDRLTGDGANNRIDGGAGTDTMAGGFGDDTYVVDQSGDVVTELTGQGTDTVLSAANYSLAGQFIEKLTLTGSANVTATGNSLANVLTGNSGNNTLNGGTGADTMAGGLGNDAYVVDGFGDVVTELLDQGTDTVFSSVGFSLAGQYLENLTLIGTDNINGAGNGLANVLTGNAGNNSLNGGAGADTMAGGLGNDIYVVDIAGDVVTELLDQGTDTVLSSVTYSLAGQYLENLTLTGTANINATGNSLANVLTGNSGTNALSGGAGNDTLDGGAGIDTMTGGTGDDTFTVDLSTDVVVELAGEGTDTVFSSATFSLAGQFLENLTLTGNAAVNGTGNSLANVLTGNSAVNTLIAGGNNDRLDGKLGSDILTGDAGLDTFAFSTALGVDNVDRITSFSTTDDTIELWDTVFVGLASGPLVASAFKADAPADADTRILYNSATGTLSFDQDGSGATFGAIAFAILDNRPALTASSFTVHTDVLMA